MMVNRSSTADIEKQVDEHSDLSQEIAGTTRYGTDNVNARAVDKAPPYQRPCHKWGLILSFLLFLAAIKLSLQDKVNPKSSPTLLGGTKNVESSKSRTLLLLRHAKSSWDDPNLEDFDRPLAEVGHKAALRLGWYLSANKVEPPDMIYVSPSKRTKQTLALVRKNGWAEITPVILDEGLFDFSDDNDAATNSYVDFISRRLDESFRRVMIVGHNPPIGALAGLLLPNDEAVISKFSPGTFCEVLWTELDTWKAFMNKKRELGLWLNPKLYPW